MGSQPWLAVVPYMEYKRLLRWTIEDLLLSFRAQRKDPRAWHENPPTAARPALVAALSFVADPGCCRNLK